MRTRKLIVTYRSCNKLAGYLEPGGKSDFSLEAAASGARPAATVSFPLDFEEFPAFPDLIIPLRGAIELYTYQ